MENIIKDVSHYSSYNITLAEMAFENGLFDSIEDAFSVFKYIGYDLLTRNDFDKPKRIYANK